MRRLMESVRKTVSGMCIGNDDREEVRSLYVENRGI